MLKFVAVFFAFFLFSLPASSQGGLGKSVLSKGASPLGVGLSSQENQLGKPLSDNVMGKSINPVKEEVEEKSDEEKSSQRRRRRRRARRKEKSLLDIVVDTIF